MVGVRWRFAFLLLFAACARSEPIRIGLIASLSGRNYGLGVSARDGAIFAADEVNAAGGIHGRKIELLIRDDEQDPSIARSHMEAFVKAGVAAVIGPVTSNMVEAVLPIADREKMLVISPTASAPSLAGKNDYLTMMTRPSVTACLLADQLRKEGKVHRVAAILDLSNSAYTQYWHDEFKKEFTTKGGEVFRTLTFTSGATQSFGSLVDQALADSPDAILLLANALDTAALAQQVRKRAKTPILGTAWGFTGEALESGGSAVEGARFVKTVNLEERGPRLSAFATAYRTRFKRDVDFATILAADAVHVLSDGMSRQSPRQGLRDAIIGHPYEGLEGGFSIDQKGDVERRSYLMTIRGAKIVRVE